MRMENKNYHNPPPPYEADGRQQRQRLSPHDSDTDTINDTLNETIPKRITANMGHQSNGRSLKQQVDELNSKHQCATGSHQHHQRQHHQRNHGSQLPNPSSEQQQAQFINSISGGKGFWRNITVEPVAFLAIVALYIEFPSIQDLIYTKICLDVITNNPNITFFQPSVIATNHSSQPQNLSTSAIEFYVTDSSIAHLSSDGRISQNGAHINSLEELKFGNYANHSNRANVLCDRLNKTAIPDAIRQQIVNEDSLFWLKYQILICLLCTISCPYWGGISDKLGRIIPLNMSILVDAFSNLISLIFGLLISYHSHNLYLINWLYLGAILVGLSGGQAVLIVNSFGFISDNTSSDARSKRILILESAIFLAHSIGFLLNKYMMSMTQLSSDSIWFNRHFVAFGTCILLNLLAFLYSMATMRHQRFHRFLNNFEREQQEAAASVITASSSTIVSDTRSQTNGGLMNSERARELTSSTPDDLDGPIAKSDRTWTNWGTIFTIRYFRDTYNTAAKPRESRSIILLLLLSGFLSALSLATLMSLLFIYLKMDPFLWTTSQYSGWNSYSAITRGAALVLLTICMRFVQNWAVPDTLVAALGFLSKGVGLLMIALAESSTIIYWAMFALIPSEFSMPPIRSLLSKLVVKDELGKVYSCLAAIQSICFLLGNVAFYLAYTTLERQDSIRLSFIVVGGLQFVAIIIMLIIGTILRRRSPI